METLRNNQKEVLQNKIQMKNALNLSIRGKKINKLEDWK